jgi:hypothetical protein
MSRHRPLQRGPGQDDVSLKALSNQEGSGRPRYESSRALPADVQAEQPRILEKRSAVKPGDESYTKSPTVQCKPAYSYPTMIRRARTHFEGLL